MVKISPLDLLAQLEDCKNERPEILHSKELIESRLKMLLQRYPNLDPKSKIWRAAAKDKIIDDMATKLALEEYPTYQKLKRQEKLFGAMAIILAVPNALTLLCGFPIFIEAKSDATIYKTFAGAGVVMLGVGLALGTLPLVGAMVASGIGMCLCAEKYFRSANKRKDMATNPTIEIKQRSSEIKYALQQKQTDDETLQTLTAANDGIGNLSMKLRQQILHAESMGVEEIEHSPINWQATADELNRSLTKLSEQLDQQLENMVEEAARQQVKALIDQHQQCWNEAHDWPHAPSQEQDITKSPSAIALPGQPTHGGNSLPKPKP